MIRRRSLLAAVATGVVATAGCRGALTRRADGAGDDASEDAGSASFETRPIAEHGRPQDICERPLTGSDIVAIGDPEFATTWPDDPDLDYRALEPDSTVIGVRDGERARAYPLSILYAHEVVNDDFGGPLLVTYCPLCLSGFVADRRVDGEATRFDVTGHLWRPPDLRAAHAEDQGRVRSNRESGVTRTANLVMYDLATESYWSQLLGKAICGPRRGDRLEVRPFAFTTWRDWRDDHPDTDVLLPPPYSEPIR
jgi:hypothetical protein